MAAEMNAARRNALIGIAALAAGGAGLALQHYMRARREPSVEPASLGTLLALSLPDPSGKLQAIAQWKGRLLLVNFWATWCEPCREEVPALVRAQEIYRVKNLQIVGISIDSADKVSEFSTKYKINYPLVLGGLESTDLVRKLGNRSGALPYSILVSPQGKLLDSHLGGMNDQSLANFVQPHLLS